VKKPETGGTLQPSPPAPGTYPGEIKNNKSLEKWVCHVGASWYAINTKLLNAHVENCGTTGLYFAKCEKFFETRYYYGDFIRIITCAQFGDV